MVSFVISLKRMLSHMFPLEPVYRLAESEWKAFVDQFTDSLVEVDPQIPHLPPKDVIHRIYRDVRARSRIIRPCS